MFNLLYNRTKTTLQSKPQQTVLECWFLSISVAIMNILNSREDIERSLRIALAHYLVNFSTRGHYLLSLNTLLYIIFIYGSLS